MSKIGFLQTIADNLLKNPADEKSLKYNSGVVEPLPSDDDWSSGLTNNFARTVGGETPKTEAEQTFLVSKTTDEKVLRERLLTENFNYTKEDAAAFEARNGWFKIFDTGICSLAKSENQPCVAARPEDIKNWETRGGKVAVVLPDATVKKLQDFRQERVIERVVMEISDSATRESVERDLKQITTAGDGAPQDRTAAANRLTYLENVKDADKSAARRAIRTVSEQPENKNNALVNLTAARIRFDEAAENNRAVVDVERQLTIAVRLAQGQDAATGEFDKNAAINRREASWVNRQAAAMLRETGNPAEADKREMMARYYEIDDKERARYENGKFTDLMSLPRWKKTDGDAVRPTTPEEQAWRSYQKQTSDDPNVQKELGEDPFKRVWTVPKFKRETKIGEVDGNGNIVANKPLVEFQREGLLRTEGTKQVEQTTYFGKKGIRTKEGLPYDYSQSATINRTIRGQDLNPEASAHATEIGSAVSALDIINNNVPFCADLYYGTTQNKIASRDKLEKSNFNAQNYPVPPKPEDLPKERIKLVRILGTDKKAEAQINLIMREMKERTYAFWGRK